MATLDLISVDEARQSLNADTDSDFELATVITAASKKIDHLCGPVVIRTVTETHRLDHPHPRQVWPRDTPVSSVTSVTEWDGTSATTTTLTADTFGAAAASDGYRLVEGHSPHGTRIARTSAGTPIRFQEPEVQLVYEAGRAADTASVDELFKRACTFLVVHLWKTQAPSWYTDQDFLAGAAPGATVPRFGIPNVVTEMLGDHLRVV